MSPLMLCKSPTGRPPLACVGTGIRCCRPRGAPAAARGLITGAAQGGAGAAGPDGEARPLAEGWGLPIVPFAHLHVSLRRATAMAAMPSPWPMAPIPSLVVALTLTRAP